MSHDELIERLTEAEVREPRRPSGAYRTTLGAQAAAALRELQAERDALQRKLTDATNPALQEQIDRLKSNLSALEDEKNAYIDYVGDALQQQVDALKAKNERLKRYIQDDWEHSDMCASHDLLGAATDNCNCGLRETLKALAGKEAG